MTDVAWWWWLSFVDPAAPHGKQFLGVCVVKAHNFVAAVQRAHSLGINPGGQARGRSLSEEPPDTLRDKLVSDREELDRIVRQWTGEGVSEVSWIGAGKVN